jgi:hypothetical protein
MRYPTLMVLAIALTACASAEEKARQRDSAMVAQAIADSVSEQEFVEDSSKLAASITLDTVKELRIRDVRSPDDHRVVETFHQAVSPTGQFCTLTVEKYPSVAVGDTLSCQWSPAP